MDSTDMDECDGSCETSKIIRDEDIDVKHKTIDVDLDSYYYSKWGRQGCSSTSTNSTQTVSDLDANIDFDSNENVGFGVVMENKKELEDLPNFDKLSITD
uniref:Uncharacterized protein n=1 Tax=Cucumis melo TaxID=3656 RepID=A0A9I9EDX9_CUCME